MQSLDFGTVALGVALAIFWPVATASLRPGRIRARRPLLMMRLFGRVVVEMLRSNVEVARTILSPRSRNIHSAFVRIPLELHDRNGLAVLAMIITFTPGTAWVQLSADEHVLLLHILAVEDEATLVQLIKRNYERPLMEIFQ
jgi:multicomponent K+:H+ antiporter subunit E